MRNVCRPLINASGVKVNFRPGVLNIPSITYICTHNIADILITSSKSRKEERKLLYIWISTLKTRTIHVADWKFSMRWQKLAHCLEQIRARPSELKKINSDDQCPPQAHSGSGSETNGSLWISLSLISPAL